MTNIQSGRL